ncbi:hypothetical protein [Streptomyces sp. NPDC004728]|uniref:hypothetical protein n=1 Tax=Streptomyces sp. NPDC004728 TaxID=3154289 RepID=UPI0033ACC85C
MLRVDDRRVDEADVERKQSSSKIEAPWCRKSPKLSEVLPLLCLHGLSYGNFVPALEHPRRHRRAVDHDGDQADEAAAGRPRRLQVPRPARP